MIEVFKTNIETLEQAKLVSRHLSGYFPSYSINFDLEDCDNILRVACDEGSIDKISISLLVSQLGHHAEILEEYTEAFLQHIFEPRLSLSRKG